MEVAMMETLGKMGAVAALGLAGVGSSFGTALAASAAIGAWKKSYVQGKNALFTLLVFVGVPLSQTIYGMLMMNSILSSVKTNPTNWAAHLGAGIFGGLAMAASAWFQSSTCAAAIDALNETGKGMVNYLMVIGIIETVALFVLVFITGAFA